MQIDDDKIQQIIKKLEYAMNTLGDMHSWLPQAIHNAIDHALHGHDGTLDHVDIDKMTRERKEDEKIQTEISSLHAQIQESQKQTKYLLYALIITIFSLLFNAILQINPNLFGLLK